MKAGAYGYLLKNTPLNEIAECIRAVAQGERWIPPAVAVQLGKRVANRGLTFRETEVLRALTNGKSNKEIGVVLDIREATVKVHMQHILEKLNVTGLTEAFNVAVNEAWCTLIQPQPRDDGNKLKTHISLRYVPTCAHC